MFEIRFEGPDTVLLCGRLTAKHEAEAETLLAGLDSDPPVAKRRSEASEDSPQRVVVVDFTELEYIASNGLGLLFAAHKRLYDTGDRMKLVNLNPHIREVFKLAGFDTIFEIE